MWNTLLRPLLFLLPAETAHHVSMTLFAWLMKVPPVKRWLLARTRVNSPRLATSLGALELPNPVGLAAGFDKDGRYFEALGALGFGFVEIGTVTAQPQPGNPRPRLFRIPEDRALLNRMGFNNDGADAARARVAGRRGELVVGINIGKSKVVSNEEAVTDYLASFERLAPHADYVVVNVSSPNTPNLRQLQAREPLEKLLSALSDANEALLARGMTRRPLFVKLAPDLPREAMEEAVEVALRCRLDGIIATNTTNARESLSIPKARVDALGAGGLSGAPLTERSRRFVEDIYRMTEGEIPIVGVGGILEPEDAWAMICAGASAVQIYTGFIYGGPWFPAEVVRHIDQRLREHGYQTVAEAVGCRAHSTNG